MAHNANVNCLALGSNSGRILATGGEDRKVNVWAIGKPNVLTVSLHAVAFLSCVSQESGCTMSLMKIVSWLPRSIILLIYILLFTELGQPHQSSRLCQV